MIFLKNSIEDGPGFITKRISNNTGQALTVYGMFLYGVAPITLGLDCTNGIAGHHNSTIQTYMSELITLIKFTSGQSVPIGQNYLYSMINFTCDDKTLTSTTLVPQSTIPIIMALK